jgi:ECF sigma factor
MAENPRTKVSELLVKWGYCDQEALNQRTIKREWSMARAWLHRQMDRQ